MVMCLDTAECRHENQRGERFCANCGLPIVGSILQNRYEIHMLQAKDRNSVTLSAFDRLLSKPVIVRVLRPYKTQPEEREDFLQEAEMARIFSSTVREPGSVRVTDFGEDGPVAFLVKMVLEEPAPQKPSERSRVVVGGTTDDFTASSAPSPAPAQFASSAPVMTKARQFIPQGGFAAQPQAGKRDWLAQGDRVFPLAAARQSLPGG